MRKKKKVKATPPDLAWKGDNDVVAAFPVTVFFFHGTLPGRWYMGQDKTKA